MTTKPVKIEAAAYLEPSGRFITSAERLASAIVLALQSASNIQVSFSNLRGLPSGYFNTVLLCVANESGNDALERRLTFVFENDAQRDTFQRSMRAVLNSLANTK